MARRKKPKIVYIDDPESVAARNVARKVLSAVEPDPVAEASAGQDIASRSKGRGGFNWLLTAVFSLIAISVLAAFIFIPASTERLPQPKKVLLPNCLGFHPDIDWGYELHDLECTRGTLSEGQNLADLLLTWRVDYKLIIQLLQMAADQKMPVMDQGNKYTLLHAKGNPFDGNLFLYEPSPELHVLLNLKGKPAVYLHRKAELRHEKSVAEVVVKTTLAEEMYNRMFGLRMTRDIEEALKYKLDLFHLEPGDQLRLLYDEIEYEGGHVEIGKVVGIQYKVASEAQYAFWFPDDIRPGYYDLDGYPMIDGFLKAPLEFGRISSPYNLERPDPLGDTGEIIPHLGTDYAAPEGTPILAVGDGEVMESEFRGNNGNYVKLWHSDQIQTQYLHMSAFAEGIEPGVQVRQGQVIGYVGSTGRSTGPHVCFRFWKDGEQVDHRKEKGFGAPPPLDGEELIRYQMHRDSLLGAFGGV